MPCVFIRTALYCRVKINYSDPTHHTRAQLAEKGWNIRSNQSKSGSLRVAKGSRLEMRTLRDSRPINPEIQRSTKSIQAEEKLTICSDSSNSPFSCLQLLHLLLTMRLFARYVPNEINQLFLQQKILPFPHDARHCSLILSIVQPITCKLIMSDKEMQVILNKADECMGDECPLDELDALLTMLKDTQETLEGRLENVSHMIEELNHLNGKEGRETDEVKAFVKDMLRVFSHDVSLVYCI